VLTVNHLKGRGNFIATSNNMKLVHWPLMGGLLQLTFGTTRKGLGLNALIFGSISIVCAKKK